MSESVDKMFEGLMAESEEDNFLKAIKLFQSGDNVHLKTEIKYPFILAHLKSLSDFLEKKEFKKTQKILDTILTNLLEYRVSKNRKSREEMVEAIKNLREKEKDNIQGKLDKLLDSA